MTDPRLAVVVLAAGQGTRMRSRTAKVLHPLAGLPMVAHVLATARALAAQHLLVVVRHERDAVAAAVAEAAPEARIVDQDEVPGTGRALEVAVASLPGGFDGDVLVLNGDVPLLDRGTLEALLAQHRADTAAASLLTARFADPDGYGRVLRGGDGHVDRIVEQRDATPDELAVDEVNAGVYVFRAAGLAARLAALDATNDQGERYLTDVIGALRGDREPVAAVVVPDASVVAGINDRAQLAEVAKRMNAAIVRRWQLAGVSVQDPATTWIDARASLEEDVTVLPNTHVLGATTVARDAVIGPDTTLVDSEVGEAAHVRRSEVTLAVIGARADVGPFTYIRAGTVLGERGKLGAYVETKNAEIGAGTKVPHLSYVGDATVGEGTNLGCGTITANYDGEHKHRTEIGSQVRSASNTVYVAPVRIGDGAYTGAGAIIRKDVPAGALALTVAPQRNVEGWVAEHRPGSASAEAAKRAAGESGDA